tara:strand:- start:219 stop:962 length:744 start_codon:yes stop_codon:yes gene_type:complete
MIKNVIIIGGTKGIGLSMSKKFLYENNIVHIISRNGSKNLEEELGSKAFFYNCDATKIDELSLTRKKILKNSDGSIDIVICNVGNGSGSNKYIQDFDEWDKSWQTNFNSPVFSSRIFLDDLKKTKGVLLFITSIAGIEDLGAPVSYSVAKSAIESYSKLLARRLGPDVRVNTIAPGNIFIQDGTWDKKLKDNPGSIKKMIESQVPMKRFGKPEEVSELAFFLCSDKASFITGSCFVIDGGQTKTIIN